MIETPYQNIVISGTISTGKSTLAKNLAKALSWKYLSSGEYFRNWHKKHNIPLDQPDQVPENVDRELDMGYQKLMTEENGIVFESHLGGWLAKGLNGTFKVLCKANNQTRIERAAKRDGVSVEQAEVEAAKRAKILYDKFKKLYGVEDPFDPKYFDLVVDTSYKSPEEVLQVVLESMNQSFFATQTKFK